MENAMTNRNMMAAEENKQPHLLIRQKQNAVWQSALKDLIDPASKMDEEEEKEYLQRIMAKLKNGKKLTSDELNYLKLHNHALYLVAMRVQLAKERLENQLKNCKSKEEVNNVISFTLGGISDKDPDKEYMIAGINETVQKFKKSSRYARLPETADTHKEKKKKNVDTFKNNDEEDDLFKNITPIQELLDELPTFDVMQ